MIFTMDSKVFLSIFIEDEDYNTILKSNYIIVSTRIKKRDEKNRNIISGVSLLYPSSDVFQRVTEEDQCKAYYEQLDEHKAFFASIIRSAIKDKENFIFMCTKRETKLKYIEWLSDWVYVTFGYPVYDYLYYTAGEKLVKYNKEKVLKRCNKIIDKQKDINYEKQRKTERGRSSIMNTYENMSKKELRKVLEEQGLASDSYDMSRKEMLELLDAFL